MKTSTPSVMEVESSIEEFISLVTGGMEQLIEAGKLVAKLIEQDEGVIDRICKRCPTLTPEIIIRFEQVGLKKLHPNLLVFDGPGPARLARMPFHVQEKYASQPVPLLINSGGHWEILPTDIRNLSVAQSNQVFGKDGMRSEAGQRAWIETQAAKRIAPPTKANMPYRTSGKSLVIMEPCTLTAKELAGILATMS